MLLSFNAVAKNSVKKDCDSNLNAHLLTFQSIYLRFHANPYYPENFGRVETLACTAMKREGQKICV